MLQLSPTDHTCVGTSLRCELITSKSNIGSDFGTVAETNAVARTALCQLDREEDVRLRLVMKKRLHCVGIVQHIKDHWEEARIPQFLLQLHVVMVNYLVIRRLNQFGLKSPSTY